MRLRHFFAGKGIAQTGRVGQQMSQRDRGLCRAQTGAAILVKAFEQIGMGKLGKNRTDWIVKRQQTAFDQLHRCNRRNRLGHRCDAEYIVQCHGPARSRIGDASGCGGQKPVTIANHGHRSRERIFFKGVFEGFLQISHTRAHSNARSQIHSQIFFFITKGEAD